MPAYKDIDKETGRVKSWYVSFTYTDWTGSKKRKLKRGFKTRGAALAYEQDFIERLATTPSMSFQTLYERYISDMENRVKKTSLITITRQMKKHVLPVFGEVPINKITPAMIRRWQADLLGLGLAPTTCHCINATFSTFFNYAVRYYHLPQNPAKIAGGIGAVEHRELFWTREQFDAFILSFDRPIYIVFFSLLFWSGARAGEVLALNGEDFAGGAISITKTFTHAGGEDIIQPPKTKGSIRRVPLPSFMCELLAEWIEHSECAPNSRIFEQFRFIGNLDCIFREHRDALNLPAIPIHGLRHSHASYLVSKGVEMFELMKRLGHNKISTTIDTYSHLYKEKQEQIAQLLSD